MPVAPVQNLAPVYRYYTADLLTGRVLSEIPFGNVNYERALKAAGSFSGKIPAIEDTAHLDLYDSTMPGKTALYVVRNDVCVWGGIIWARSYDVSSRVLTVSASEFVSYLYHRRIWKTWNHQFEAVITVTSGEAAVELTNGSTTALNPGTSVHVEFYEPADFKYNDYYTVASSPAPSVDGFSIGSVAKTAVVTGARRSSGVTYITTESVHNYAVGDTVTISGLPSGFNGTQVITSVNNYTGTEFTYANAGTEVIHDPGTLNGLASRTIPDGTYVRATITVRTDTFDYVRGLLDGMFTDFTGIDFPNIYIEPGVSYPNDVTNMHVQYGKARLKTAQPHNLTIGQAVQIQDVSPLVDGERVVTDTPNETEFWFELGGLVPSTPVNVTSDLIDAVEASGNMAKLYLDASNFYPGQNVYVDFGAAVPGGSDIFSGSYVIVDRDEESYDWIRYRIASSDTVPYTVTPTATATVGGSSKNIIKRKLSSNVATMTTTVDHGFSVGNSVTIANATPRLAVSEKFLDAANSEARITTVDQHYLQTGDQVVISGLRDDSAVKTVAQSGTKVTLTLEKPHNFRVGETVTVKELQDPYTITNMAITSNVVTLTTKGNHNLTGAGKPLTVSNLYDTRGITNKRIFLNTATITTNGVHNFRVNEKVTISGITDSIVAVSKAYDTDKVVTLLTDVAHNFYVGDEITVTGVGAPYDGTFTVFEVDDYTVRYDATETINALFEKLTKQNLPKDRLPYERPPTRANGLIKSANSIFNGEHVVETVTSTTFTFRIAGNDVPSTSVTPSVGKVKGLLFFNGSHSLVSTTANTVSFNVTGAQNMASVAVPLPPAAEKDEEQQPPATVSMLSRHNGNRVLTAISGNTLSFTSTGGSTDTRPAIGSISANSIFNGTRTITSVTPYSFTYTLTGKKNNVYETTVQNKAYVTFPSLYNGTYTITSVPTPTTFTFSKAHVSQPETTLPVPGTASVHPLIVVSSFGPYPSNADIDIEYSTRRQSGIDTPPPLHRGFELASVGDVLDAYSDGVGGFEYRIDCSFDAANNRFRKTFVFIPINFPDPPAPGEISPVSRFGADKLVFEYPGNIKNVILNESAENAATRFFAVGETDLGPDVGPPFSVAVADDLLNRTDDPEYREWPLLDEDEKVDGTEDKNVLYNYATRYLNESRPPQAQFTVEVNGSLQPFIGTYNPGDWCSVVIDDEFIRMRLLSDLEPRDTVIVRKIDGIRVSVPDGTTVPENVTLVLIPEWEVDKRG